MKNIKSLVIMSFLTLSMLVSNAQKKKVAVITFYADKTIDLSALSASADLIAKNTKLSDDPDFNLTEPLKKLHQAFFAEYTKNFDFEIIDEAEVLSNETYKTFVPTYQEGNTFLTNVETTTSIEGYNVIPSTPKASATSFKSFTFFRKLGIMFVNLSFGFVKTGIGSMGYVSVQARYSMDLFTKDNNSIFQFREVAGSKKKAVMVGGFPVMSTSKIQPMCESAVDQLMKDLNKKVARLAKKANKKMK